MAISTNCCLKFKPPTARSTPHKAQNLWIICRVPGEESRQGTKWPTRVASIVIGLEMANLVLALGQWNSLVVAREIQSSSLAMESSKTGAVLNKKWSEKRVCPPWHLNSLENIVPENLPRPSAKRRFEAVGYHDAPAVKFDAKHVTSKCFTM
ncbi:hypothetical protein LIER_38380 [Lithospermum erythrorhizon]|uniref:Uncharacterized protein n=1 Tax=Lithospermum erythrorhizon TaxID=34254 RepID=A0AAV3Q1A7_LITER